MHARQEKRNHSIINGKQTRMQKGKIATRKMTIKKKKIKSMEIDSNGCRLWSET